MKYLFVIPARGGSKGIPHKNIKPLCGKPLIEYSIDVARKVVSDEDICVTTDDDEIAEAIRNYGLKIPFMRPKHLATDTCGTYEVLLHAILFYESQGKHYDAIVLLQPTSPFRKVEYIEEAIAIYNQDLDMVVSVKEASSNPYYNCFEENKDSFLFVSKGNGKLERRQDAPKAWDYNGSIYVINISSLKEKNLSEFSKIKKYEMDKLYSIDIDNQIDWIIAESILNSKTIRI